MERTAQIFGTFAAAVTLFDRAKAVIGRFGSGNPQIAPDALCRLYFLLTFLHDDDVHVLALPQQLEEFESRLETCRSLLERYSPPVQPAATPGASRYAWPATAEAKLRSELDKLDRDLISLSFSTSGKRPTWQLPQSLEPPSVQATIRASKARQGERKDSLKFVDLPVTIILRASHDEIDGDEYEMKSINIAERSETYRTLQNKSADGTVVISHRILRNHLPLVEESLVGTQVEFNTGQKLIVQTKEGHEAAEYFPIYKFKKWQDLDRFIHKVRERNLVDKFLPNSIYPNDSPKNAFARFKVVRLWEKIGVPSGGSILPSSTLVTLTFLGTSGRQQELDLAHYELATLSKNGKAVEIRPAAKPDPQRPDRLNFLFSDKDKSEIFLKKLNEVHPQAGHRQRMPSLDIDSFPEQIDLGESSTQPSTAPGSSILSRSSAEVDTPLTPFIKEYSVGPLTLPPPIMTEEPKSFGSQLLGRPHSPSTSPRQRPVDRRNHIGRQRHPQAPRSREDFAIAIICALRKECDAVIAAFDQDWNEVSFGLPPSDDNTYSFGSIGQHHVVLVHLPNIGKGIAAGAAAHCHTSFTEIKLCLVVGICGGVPTNAESEDEPIVLGDVVISKGVVQYDLGRQYSDGFRRKDTLNDNLPQLNYRLQGLLSKLEGLQARVKLQNAIASHLKLLAGEGALGDSALYPRSPKVDKLFHASYRHMHGDGAICDICPRYPSSVDPVCEKALEESCDSLGCDEGKVIRRVQIKEPTTLVEHGRDSTSINVVRQPGHPFVHFGLYASGDKVMKSGEERDNIARTEKVIAFEMEGAGVWRQSQGHCLVIKGICDYADSHKSKEFQKYAAAAAAACMKAFLASWPDNGVLAN